MSDVAAGGGGEGAGDGGQGGVQPGAGAGELGGGGAAPEWMAALPEDLRGDATLAKYGDLGALARGHLETKRLASSRVIVPAADADDAAWGAFYGQIGRPETADKYEIPVPEGQPTALADLFKPAAHKLGLTASQAKGVAEFNNAQVQAATDKWLADSRAEIEAVKAETPEYDAKMAKARELFKSLGGDPSIAQELDLKLGSRNLVKFFLGLADKAGEHGRVDGGGGGLGGGGDPDADLSAKMKDASWREKAQIAGSAEAQEWDRLVKASAAKRDSARR